MVLPVLHRLLGRALGCKGVTAEPPGSQGEGTVILFVLRRAELGPGNTLFAHGHGSTRQAWGAHAQVHSEFPPECSTVCSLGSIAHCSTIVLIACQLSPRLTACIPWFCLVLLPVLSFMLPPFSCPALAPVFSVPILLGKVPGVCLGCPSGKMVSYRLASRTGPAAATQQTLNSLKEGFVDVPEARLHGSGHRRVQHPPYLQVFGWSAFQMILFHIKLFQIPWTLVSQSNNLILFTNGIFIL